MQVCGILGVPLSSPRCDCWAGDVPCTPCLSLEKGSGSVESGACALGGVGTGGLLNDRCGKASESPGSVLACSYCSPILFSFLILAALGLHCCAQAFSSCSARASHCGGFSCCEAQALGAQASVVVAHRVSCSMACGIFPDQGLNLCPPCCKEDS